VCPSPRSASLLPGRIRTGIWTPRRGSTWSAGHPWTRPLEYLAAPLDELTLAIRAESVIDDQDALTDITEIAIAMIGGATLRRRRACPGPGA